MEQTPSGDYVEFYSRPKQHEEETRANGRPIFVPVEYIKIVVPGDKFTTIDRPVREQDKQRYSPQYKAFRAGKDQQEASGTLLSAWGGVSPERVEEYAYFKVKTVDQLAQMSDGNLQQLGPGATADRQRARDYVEVMKGAAPVAQLRHELEEKEKRIAVLEKAVADLKKPSKSKE